MSVDPTRELPEIVSFTCTIAVPNNEDHVPLVEESSATRPTHLQSITGSLLKNPEQSQLNAVLPLGLPISRDASVLVSSTQSLRTNYSADTFFMCPSTRVILSDTKQYCAHAPGASAYIVVGTLVNNFNRSPRTHTSTAYTKAHIREKCGCNGPCGLPRLNSATMWV